MYASKQNFHSPVGSPGKRSTMNENNSPMSSPLKHPRPTSSIYGDQKGYSPV